MGDGEGDSNEHANTKPLLPSEQPAKASQKSAFTPNDLDFSESPYVEELSENRFVVATDDRPPDVPAQDGADDDPAENDADDEPTQSTTLRFDDDSSAVDPSAARATLATELNATGNRYAIDVISRLDGESATRRIASDDVVGSFDELVRWYAASVSGSTPTRRALAMLLSASDFPQVLGPTHVRRLVEDTGLERDDTIGELFDALDE
ncbi:hypothetical protein OB905_02510 [Halobacteria archaeon AArc-dxtr1]|nr:hypothetical protein [Halobacteria archaeon AArc-dxtr1]